MSKLTVEQVEKFGLLVDDLGRLIRPNGFGEGVFTVGDIELLRATYTALSERGGEQKPVGYLDWPALTFRFNGTAERIGRMPVNAEPIALFTRPQAGQVIENAAQEGASSQLSNNGSSRRLDAETSEEAPPAAAPAAPEAMVLVPENKCRDDGRCQYAIDHDAESLGNCHPDKCKMPGQQRLDDEAVGREWRTNSSLEQWFPCTAQHLKDLTEQVELLRAPACPDATAEVRELADLLHMVETLQEEISLCGASFESTSPAGVAANSVRNRLQSSKELLAGVLIKVTALRGASHE